MARLVLIRHAESVANAERRFTHGPYEPLTARGREEALRTGRRLLGRIDPVALYASPFVRAIETARLVGAALGLEPRIVEDLREQDFGELRGRPYADYGADPAASGAGRWAHRPPGGETLAEVAQRAGRALDAIASAHLGEEVVIVSHGAVMAALRGWVRQRFDEAPVPTSNTSGYLLLRSVQRYEGPLPLPIDDTADASASGSVTGSEQRRPRHT
ncbi:MAG: histidine phosphatase family protein [Deltaproteobacteria bacterium]|nr:histidine phosphatase family protein [Deltaproteobacteria bacterium]